MTKEYTIKLNKTAAKLIDKAAEQVDMAPEEFIATIVNNSILEVLIKKFDKNS